VDGSHDGEIGATDHRVAQIEPSRLSKLKTDPDRQSKAVSRKETLGEVQSSRQEQVSYIHLENVDTPGNVSWQECLGLLKTANFYAKLITFAHMFLIPGRFWAR